MRTYYVYGDYGLTSESQLYSTTSLAEARAYVHNYTRWGDTGGYDYVEVLWFAEDGECMTEMRIDAEEEELDGFDADIYAEPSYDIFSD